MNAKADVVGEGVSLSYHNRAFVHAIPGAPNPEADWVSEFAKIIYLCK